MEMRDKKFKGVPQLADLGDRIVVVGASNSGKSTLAHQIGEALDMPVVHLDQLFHEPNQRWVPRAPEEFIRLHNAAIADERWIMEGNYSNRFRESFDARMGRASFAIALDISKTTALIRYLRRCFSRQRYGSSHSGIDWPTWTMLKFLLFTPSKAYARSQLVIDSGVPYIIAHSTREAKQLKKYWGLRPGR